MYVQLLLSVFLIKCGKGEHLIGEIQNDVLLTNTIRVNGGAISKANENFSSLDNLDENYDKTHSIVIFQQRNLSEFFLRTSKEEVRTEANHLRTAKAHRRITPIMFMVPRPKSESEDVCSDSGEDFPTFLTAEQLENGAVVVCFLIGIYCFSFLAVVCDKYFLPCVERICEAFNLPQDVAAATFMSMATSAPELFVNIVGTFITESDIGIGTVVGSNLYNTLGVAALGSLAASAPIQLDWWPVTRDCVMYICSVTLLVGVAWDGHIYWYEGLIMVIAFCLYLIIQFNSKIISKYIKRWVERRKNSTENLTSMEFPSNMFEETTISTEGSDTENKSQENDTEELCTIPKGRWWSKMFYIYLWPIRVLLFCIVPNPKTKPKLFPVTFIFCVVLIGLNSYIVSWMLTLIGTTFGIPDAILGLTFLAAGGGLPESISIVILSRKGEGSIGVSNALGANSVNILMSLGLPWFISTMTMGFGPNSYVEIESGSIHYTILGLLLVVCSLFVTLYFNRFRLSRLIGVVLSIVYLSFLTLAILSEALFIDTESC